MIFFFFFFFFFFFAAIVDRDMTSVYKRDTIIQVKSNRLHSDLIHPVAFLDMSSRNISTEIPAQ